MQRLDRPDGSYAAHVTDYIVGNSERHAAFKEAAAIKRAEYERKRWATWIANGYPDGKIKRNRD